VFTVLVDGIGGQIGLNHLFIDMPDKDAGPGQTEIVLIDACEYPDARSGDNTAGGVEFSPFAVFIPADCYFVPIGITLAILDEKILDRVHRHLDDVRRGKGARTSHIELVGVLNNDRLIPTHVDLFPGAGLGRDESLKIVRTLIHQPPGADAGAAAFGVEETGHADLAAEKKRHGAKQAEGVGFLVLGFGQDDAVPQIDAARTFDPLENGGILAQSGGQ